MGFFREKPAPPYPEVPSSLSHDTFEMQNVALSHDASPPPPKYDSAGSVTPYLGLRARLSQIWFNRWTVLLALVLVRVLILVGGLNDDIDSAETEALSACTKVEDVGSAMASMPHYLSVGVNELAADGISQAVQGMVELLLMILTGVQQLILFVINMYIGTYVCLSTALIHGGLSVGIGAAEDVTDAMNDAIDTITTELSSDISSVQDTINSAFETIASASSVFGADLTAPTINITGRLDELKSIQVNDSAFVSTLETLNSSIPTYDQAENLTREAIAIPFNLVKTALNNSYGNYTFDTSVFPVAQKQALTFCSGNSDISDFFASLYAVASKAKTAFIVVLVLLAVLACVPMTWLEIRRWRSQQRRAAVLTQHGYDPMDVVYIASRPYTAGAGIRLAGRMHSGGKKQLLMRWTVAYATSFPALFVLSLAVAGYVSCICQAILLRAVQKEAPALAAQVGDFADEVVGTLANVSTAWANDANSALLSFQDDINDDVLGYVVNATTAVNDTLNTFTDEIDKGISEAFNGTVLEDVVQQVVLCLIGLKIDAIEQGLTWVHDKAHVTLPTFANDTFSAGANDSLQSDSSLSSFLASPSSVTTDEITAAVDKVVTYLRNSLVQEALISTGLLLLYVIVVLVGIVWALSRMLRPERTRAEGGQRFYAEGVNPQLNPVVAVVHDNPQMTTVAAAVPRARATASASATSSSTTVNSTAPRAFFPRFDGAPESAVMDDYAAAAARDEKIDIMASQPVSRQASRVAVEKKGHWRGSSYGDVDDAGR